MKTILFFTFSFLLFASQLIGQTKDGLSQIKTEWVEAKVIGILEDHQSLGVLSILSVPDSNEIGLIKGTEVLVEFYFGTKKREDEPQLSGIGANDIIDAEFAGKWNQESAQWEYRVFRYSVK